MVDAIQQRLAELKQEQPQRAEEFSSWEKEYETKVKKKSTSKKQESTTTQEGTITTKPTVTATYTTPTLQQNFTQKSNTPLNTTKTPITKPTPASLYIQEFQKLSTEKKETTSLLPTTQNKTFTGEIIGMYETTNLFLKEKITNPISSFLGSKGITKEVLSESFSNAITGQNLRSEEYVPLSEFLTKINVIKNKEGEQIINPESITKLSLFEQETKPFIKSTIKTEITEFQEKPAKYLLIAGATSTIPYATKLLGEAVYSIGSSIGGYQGALTGLKTANLAVQAGGIGLASIYGIETINELKTAKGGKAKGEVFGRVSAEITAGAIGGIIGVETSLGVRQVVSKSLSTVRVSGLQEIPVEEVVNPKSIYVGGTQKYPQISKGQTAGSFLQEFKQRIPGLPESASEFRYFTARPQPEISKTVTKGSSELYGEYGAQKLSPTFLGLDLKQPERMVGLGSADLFFKRPTAYVTTPESIELIPQVSPSQKSLTSQTEEVESFFSEPVGEPGKAYIPFIKTEAESVAIIGGQKTNVESVGFIDINGWKIPLISQELTSKGASNAVKNIGVIENMASSLSSYSSGGGEYISPASLSSGVFVSSSAPVVESPASLSVQSYSGFAGSSLSPVPPLYSPDIILSSSKSPIISPISGGSSGGKGSSGGGGSSPIPSPVPSPSSPVSGGSAFSPIVEPINLPGGVSLFFRKGTSSMGGKKKKGGAKQKSRYVPDLGSELGIWSGKFSARLGALTGVTPRPFKNSKW